MAKDVGPTAVGVVVGYAIRVQDRLRVCVNPNITCQIGDQVECTLGLGRSVSDLKVIASGDQAEDEALEHYLDQVGEATE